MSELKYLGYGSNLHPLRLSERISSARPLGVTTLHGWSLRFHTQGSDGSGKCDLVQTGSPKDRAFAAVYSISIEDKPTLDGYEGSPYAVHELEIELHGLKTSGFIYLARESHVDAGLVPHSWYRDIVLLGARHLALPTNYCESIQEVDARPDPDPTRATQHEQLLRRMRAFPHAPSKD